MRTIPKVISTNVSKLKEGSKTPVESIYLNNQGVKGDAHSGMWNRQVSLLAFESIKRFEKETGREFDCGEFSENITTANIDLHTLAPLDKLQIGECELEITHLNQKCYREKCHLFGKIDNCIMTREGIFGRVIKGGEIHINDEIVHNPKEFKIKTITLGDKVSKGIYKDKTGEALINELEAFFTSLNRNIYLSHDVIPDDETELRRIFRDYRSYDLIFTAGGTGIGHRDITIDVVSSLLDKQIPGIMEMIRMKLGQQNPKSLLNRGMAGVMGLTLVFCLPGSPKAVKEYCSEIFKILVDAIYMLYGLDKY